MDVSEPVNDKFNKLITGDGTGPQRGKQSHYPIRVRPRIMLHTNRRLVLRTPQESFAWGYLSGSMAAGASPD